MTLLTAESWTLSAACQPRALNRPAWALRRPITQVIVTAEIVDDVQQALRAPIWIGSPPDASSRACQTCSRRRWQLDSQTLHGSGDWNRLSARSLMVPLRHQPEGAQMLTADQVGTTGEAG